MPKKKKKKKKKRYPYNKCLELVIVIEVES